MTKNWKKLTAEKKLKHFIDHIKKVGICLVSVSKALLSDPESGDSLYPD
jgi:hypothetical protein